MTWTAAGSPYTGATVTISSGVTVTVDPGALVNVGQLYVDGTLDVNGTSGDPALFTSTYDDAPNQWNGIYLSTSSSSIDHAIVRHAKNGIVVTNGASPTISNSTVAHNSWQGISSWASSPTITGNTVTDNGENGLNLIDGGSPVVSGNTVTDNVGDYGKGGGINYEIDYGESGDVDISGNTVSGNGGLAGIRVWNSFNTTIASGPSLTDNTVDDNTGRAIQYQVIGAGNAIPADIDDNPAPSGNGSDAIWLSGHVTGSTSWAPDGYPLVFMGGDVVVDDGAALTLEPGTVLKGGETTADLDVWGALDAEGDPGTPVTITSVKDDSIGGDTNGDGGASVPSPADWGGVLMGDKCCSVVGEATLDRVEFSYGGHGWQGMVRVDSPTTSTSIRHSKLNHAATALVVVGDSGSGSEPALEYNTLKGNTDYAAYKYGSGIVHMTGLDTGSDAGPFPSGPNAVTTNISTTPAGSSADCSGESDKGDCPNDGDPVSLATGAFSYEHTDLGLSNKGDPLEFKRVYNSRDPQDASMGLGWSHSGVAIAAEQEFGDVLIRELDGRRNLFTENAGDYSPPPGVHQTLVKEIDGSFTLTTQDQTVYDFDPRGRITTITDDHGLTTTWAYSSGRISSITDSVGQSLTFTYNSDNRITKVTDSTGREVAYTYTGAGDLDTVTDPLGGVTDYDYDGAHRITAITDPRDVTYLQNTYDGQGRVVGQVDGEDNDWTIDYATGETTVTDPEGGTKTYEFDAHLRKTSVEDQLGHTTSYSYDADGNIDGITRPGGAIWAFDYDAAGNLTSSTDPEEGERSYTYDGSNHPTSYTDPRAKTWTYNWTDDDLTTATDPATGETSFTYNAGGQPLTIQDPNGHTTTYAYDSRGNRTSVTDALSHTTAYGYNARNYLTSKTEPGKAAETYGRNALGDLVSRTTPEGNTTSYDYDENGALVEITDPANELWTIERDGMEHPTAYVDPLSHSTQIAYDGNLNPILVTDRRGEQTAYSYDAAKRLVSVELPEGEAWDYAYDARDNRVSVTDPRTHTSTFEFDLADRMVAANEPESTSTSYVYDAAGNLTSITDPRLNETAFAYDDLGRMTTISQPLSKQTTFGYDDAGNVTSRTTGEGTVNYEYDDADRLTEINDGTDALRAYAYDDADRVTGATDAQSKTLEIGYDDDDNVISLDDDRGETVDREFDSRGNLTQQTDGRGVVQFGYDDLSRMISLTDPQTDVTDFGYDNEGNVTDTSLPNGVVTTNAYDGDGRMTSTSSEKAATVLQSFEYGYDANGNRTSSIDRNTDTTTYAYDALNRLTDFDPPAAPDVAYGYDDAGNRTSAGSTTYSFNDLNQLTSSSAGTSYDYDDAGRLIERDDGTVDTTYAWDPLNQLAGVDDGTSPVSYTYDGLGRRSERTGSAGTETAHYGDFTDLPVLETDATPSITRSYVVGSLGLAEERIGSTTTYPLTDARGDLTTVTDGTGTAASRQSYGPWGEQLSGPTRGNGYLGAFQRVTDANTGLLQMGVRPYVSSDARFLTEDPLLGQLGSGQSLNRTAYVQNNPLTLYDLDGRSIGHMISAGWDATAGARDSLGLAGDNSLPEAAGNVLNDARDGLSDFFRYNTCTFTAGVGDGVWASGGFKFGNGGVAPTGNIGFGGGGSLSLLCTPNGEASAGPSASVGGCLLVVQGRVNTSEDATTSYGPCLGISGSATGGYTGPPIHIP